MPEIEIYHREGAAWSHVNGVRIFHRPHPSPHVDKGAVASIREWLKTKEVTP